MVLSRFQVPSRYAASLKARFIVNPLGVTTSNVGAGEGNKVGCAVGSDLGAAVGAELGGKVGFALG